MIITSHSKGKHETSPIKLYLMEENTKEERIFVNPVSYFQQKQCHQLQNELGSKSILMEKKYELKILLFSFRG